MEEKEKRQEAKRKQKGKKEASDEKNWKKIIGYANNKTYCC
jgi:hypothetical protein